ncbi:SDR family oxidoreductase [Alphaproteobacteria bacterium]|nr:SDR family oxidoreductase [Alphaproteobacteria bacterium]
MVSILITGTNRGIGLEFVKHYLKHNEKVIATCRNKNSAKELLELKKTTNNLSLVELDVSNPNSINEFVSKITDQPIDTFINNAGVFGPRNNQFGNLNVKEWLDVFNINSIAPLLITQKILKNLRLGKSNKLVFISSKVGSIEENTGGGMYIYRSSKTALNQVIKSLSIDFKDENMIAVALHPGWVQTDMGGPNALIDTKTSVKGMVEVIDSLTLKNSGKFYNYDGSSIPW